MFYYVMYQVTRSNTLKIIYRLQNANCETAKG